MFYTPLANNNQSSREELFPHFFRLVFLLFPNFRLHFQIEIFFVGNCLGKKKQEARGDTMFLSIRHKKQFMQRAVLFMEKYIYTSCEALKAKKAMRKPAHETLLTNTSLWLIFAYQKWKEIASDKSSVASFVSHAISLNVIPFVKAQDSFCRKDFREGEKKPGRGVVHGSKMGVK